MSAGSERSSVALACTYHDPRGQLFDQLVRALPTLQSFFPSIAVVVSPTAFLPSVAHLVNNGVRVRRDVEDPGGPMIGRARRESVALALLDESPFILYCDFDRVLHWVERYPDELPAVLHRIPEHDFTVLGRTARAFASHPRVQRETEAIVNHVCRPWSLPSRGGGNRRRLPGG